MFEHTLALYEWHRSRVAQIERRLARCAGAVVDTGYKEGLETQRTRGQKRLQELEEAVGEAMRAGRPSPGEDDADATDLDPTTPPECETPLSMPARLMSWLRLRVS